MPEPAIIVKDLSKSYRLGVIGRQTLQDEVRYWWHKVRGRNPLEYMGKIGQPASPPASQARALRASSNQHPRPPRKRERCGQAASSNENPNTFWALKDISFTVQPGEVLGIIGRNGAGKTTLLKILTRITEPTSGTAIINGRVASLLEVGTGFHAELTGRENVFLNGSILGMKQAEIARKFEDIIEFAEIHQFIDTPVKRYSSGMYVRLAFAVAAHLDPEMLLIDEVLAVGDVEFQKKCLGKMKDVAKHGRTILFVSHNMIAIKNLCERVLLIDKGRVVKDGKPDEVISKYLSRNLTEGAVASLSDIEKRMEGVIKRHNPYIRFVEISLRDDTGQSRNAFYSTETIFVSIDFQCLKRVKDLYVRVDVVDEHNNAILSTNNLDEKSITDNYNRLEIGSYNCYCILPENMFCSRTYFLTVHLLFPKTEHLVVEKILEFNVRFNGYNNNYDHDSSAFIRPKLNWKMKPIGNGILPEGQ